MSRTARTALAVAASGLLAGCSTHAAASSGVPASRYVVCQSVVGTCVGATPKHEPSVLYLSADGSLWAKDITWRGWGTATATGHGTAEANDCTPNCAQGKFTAHPVELTLTRPEPWHNDRAYSRAVISIPSLHEHVTFATGLVPSPLPPQPPATTPAAPGPVSTQAAVSGDCAMGYEPAYTESNGNIAYGPFTPGLPTGYVTLGGQQYSATLAYQLTLTDTGGATAAVSGFVVAFYDGSGQELGSDQRTFYTPTYLTAGQGLVWTQFSGTDTLGNGLSGDGGTGSQDNSIPSSGAATCQLVEWTHP